MADGKGDPRPSRTRKPGECKQFRYQWLCESSNKHYGHMRKKRRPSILYKQCVGERIWVNGLRYLNGWAARNDASIDGSLCAPVLPDRGDMVELIPIEIPDHTKSNVGSDPVWGRQLRSVREVW